MKPERAEEIYRSLENVAVHLDDGQPVWIEKVDAANGVATVQVGTSPLNTQTVEIGRLEEK